MDVREKLVELAKPVLTSLPFPWCTVWRDVAEKIADAYIAHGVTVQKWFSATNPPQEDERVLVWLGNNRYNDVKIDTDRFRNGRWVRWGDCVTHWAPIGLSQPPSELYSGGKDDGC